MSGKTDNYNLHTIDLTDAPPDITVLNQNWQTIDAELHRISELTNQGVIYDVSCSYDSDNGVFALTADNLPSTAPYTIRFYPGSYFREEDYVTLNGVTVVLKTITGESLRRNAWTTTTGQVFVTITQSYGSLVFGYLMHTNNRMQTVDINIDTSAWESSYEDDFPYAASIEDYDIFTSNTVADVTLDVSCIAAAQKAGVCPTVETSAGHLTIYAKKIPTVALTGICRILEG